MELPIFPLPDLVFFPHTSLPLHIFEPRYRHMVSDAVEGERLIGMALLQPGWEAEYYRSPEVFAVGGMGRIAQWELLDEGKYNIVLEGRARYEIVRFVQDSPYRVAEIRQLAEVIPTPEKAGELAAELVRSFQELSEAAEPVLSLDILEELEFTTLVNSICSAMSLSAYDKQRLLELGDVRRRAERILEIFRRQISRKRFVSRYRHLQPDDPKFN